MKDREITELLQKVDELRLLFVLGQRVIPFLEEIFLFVKEIHPVLDEINASIEENLKKMPGASQQLSKVTEATEHATTEIMDIVDGLFYKADLISSNMARMDEIVEQSQQNPIKLLEIIHKAIQQKSDLQEILPQLSNSIKGLKSQPNKEYNKMKNETNGILDSVRNDTNSIMMSLQVQDISSQQIAAVNHLLETIQHKLTKIMTNFKSSEINDIISADDSADEDSPNVNVSKLHREIAFDPDAVDSYINKDSRQAEVDKVIEGHSDEGGVNEPVSPEDIDAMFNGNDKTDKSASDSETDVIDNGKDIDDPGKTVNQAESVSVAMKQPEDDDHSEPFSQDDIDAMFGK